MPGAVAQPARGTAACFIAGSISGQPLHAMFESIEIAGGITAPEGFRASGVRAGLKKTGPDLALIVSDLPASVAGVFTTNSIVAAPVKVCRARLAGGIARAVVVNSGCANACTGPRGIADAMLTARIVAHELGIDEQTVFVCSTGVIGRPLPMRRLEKGIRTAARELSRRGGSRAARAIMTTDTFPKQAAVELRAGGARCRIGGMAKGSGMIEPNMATMLAFLTTDAPAPRPLLQQYLSEAVAESFNRISLDGCRSTNDTVLLMANGAAGTAGGFFRSSGFLAALREAVSAVAQKLALKIVEDGEGATKFVTVKVSGARSDSDADKVARSVANSLLVKTSWYGEDPNWGRVMAAIGQSGVRVGEDAVCVAYSGVPVVANGRLVPGVSAKRLARVLAGWKFAVEINLNAGRGAGVIYTCDCTRDYVRINAGYTT